MKCSWIEPGVLAAGDIPISEQDIRSLHAQGIRAVLSLTERSLLSFQALSMELFDSLDMLYFHVPIPDQYPPTDEQAQHILQILNEMMNQGRPCFTHCHAGVGRTGTILHLYYLSQGLSFEATREKIRARRVQCILLSDAQMDFLKGFADQ